MAGRWAHGDQDLYDASLKRGHRRSYTRLPYLAHLRFTAVLYNARLVRISRHGLRQIRRHPPLDLQADTGRRLVSPQRTRRPPRRVSSHPRRLVSRLSVRGRRPRALRGSRRSLEPPRRRQSQKRCRPCRPRRVCQRRQGRLHLCRRKHTHPGHGHHGPPAAGRQGTECRIHRTCLHISPFLHLSASQRDERVLVVWSDSLDTIIPIARDFEDRLIRLLWRNRPPFTSSVISSPSAPPSVSGHSNVGTPQVQEKLVDSESPNPTPQRFRRTWYGRKVAMSPSECEKADQEPPRRNTALYAPVYNGLAAGLAAGMNAYGTRVTGP